MFASRPLHCRPQAYELVVSQVSCIDSVEGLFRAALGVSMHALDDVDPEKYLLKMAALADRVSRRVPSGQPSALIAHLHQVLFDEEGYAGNTEDYYSPLNSYLPTVIENRRGIPVTLTLVYRMVAHRLGIDVQGLNTPGHFLARVELGDESMIVDPYFAGQILTLDEACERIHQACGVRVSAPEDFFHPITNLGWLSRIIANLQAIFRGMQRETDLAAMNELQALIMEGK